MNKSQRFFLLKTKLYLIVPLLCAQVAMAQSQIYWEAFNDYRPEVGVTSDNATGYDLRITGDGGTGRGKR